MQSATALDQLVQELEQIDEENELRSISLKCVACIAFTDHFLEEISRAQSELAVYVGDIRRQASELKMQCDKVVRNHALESFNLSAVQEAYEEIVGLLENVCLLVAPGLVERVDAAAL
jgi:hypothetical protein